MNSFLERGLISASLALSLGVSAPRPVSAHERTSGEKPPLPLMHPNSPDISGGEEAKPGEAPFFVEMRWGGGHLCGGTIVGKHTISTATHCLNVPKPDDDERYSRFDIIAGTTIVGDTQGSHHQISECKNYSDNHDSDPDIALCSVTPDFPSDSPLIALADLVSTTQEITQTTTFGMGRQSPDENIPSTVLKKITQPYNEDPKCIATRLDFPMRACVGTAGTYSETQKGDSGSGFMAWNLRKGRYELASSVWAGFGVGLTLGPDFRYPAFQEWMRETITNFEESTPKWVPRATEVYVGSLHTYRRDGIQPFILGLPFTYTVGMDAYKENFENIAVKEATMSEAFRLLNSAGEAESGCVNVNSTGPEIKGIEYNPTLDVYTTTSKLPDNTPVLTETAVVRQRVADLGLSLSQACQELVPTNPFSPSEISVLYNSQGSEGISTTLTDGTHTWTHKSVNQEYPQIPVYRPLIVDLKTVTNTDAIPIYTSEGLTITKRRQGSVVLFEGNMKSNIPEEVNFAYVWDPNLKRLVPLTGYQGRVIGTADIEDTYTKLYIPQLSR